MTNTVARGVGSRARSNNAFETGERHYAIGVTQHRRDRLDIGDKP
jgi:hypothetical protein